MGHRPRTPPPPALAEGFRWLASHRRPPRLEETPRPFRSSSFRSGIIGPLALLSLAEPGGVSLTVVLTAGALALLALGLCLALRKIARLRTHLEDARRAVRESARRSTGDDRTHQAFLAITGHEFRTPLTGLLGMVTLLEETDLGERQADCVKGIRQTADDLLTVFNDVLDWTLIESGRSRPECIGFDVRATVETVTERCRERSHQKGLVISHIVDPSVPKRVRGDAGRLLKILSRLAHNALKFTEEGHIAISVRRVGASSRGHQLEFAVEDTGPGIPEEARARLFRPFYQVEDYLRRQHGGLGLGLAISARLVEGLGGGIQVEDREGGGSVFRFAVPLGTEDTATVESGGSLSVESLRILVVHHDGRGVQPLIGVLRRLGVNFDTAEPNRCRERMAEAVQSDSPYQAVIVDEESGRASALDLASEIRARADLRGARLVLLTAPGMRGDASEARRYGFEAYLAKPVGVDALRACLALCNAPHQQPAPDLLTRHALRERIRAHRQHALLLAPRGGGRVRLAARLEELGLRLDVADDGCPGIEAIAHRDYEVLLVAGPEAPSSAASLARAVPAADAGSARIAINCLVTEPPPEPVRKELEEAGVAVISTVASDAEGGRSAAELERLLRRWIPHSLSGSLVLRKKRENQPKRPLPIA